MVKRIAAIAFIFVCASIAWGFLAATIYTRTYSSGGVLRGKVAGAWGSEHRQMPPTLHIREKDAAGKERCVRLPLESTRLNVRLDLEHRQKGLLWFNTYKVAFSAGYVFRNDTASAAEVRFRLPLPAGKAVYDGLAVTRDGAPLATTNNRDSIEAVFSLPPGASTTLQAAYRSQGLDRWEYRFAEGAGDARNFASRITTNFHDVDFPENALPPTAKRRTSTGWELDWTYASLVSGVPLAVVMPGKPQPGPLAGEISSFAPVSLFFFFFLMLVITTLKNIDLHPVNYFFLACAFFSFHLLLAYLVDHISIHAAFAICSAVSILLVVSYLRLVVGLRFALVEAGLSQFAYLVLFSYAFFIPGYTGLAITVGAVVTLFVVMQATARIDWRRKFSAPPVRPTAAA